jgi:hypothetical protein
LNNREISNQANQPLNNREISNQPLNGIEIFHDRKTLNKQFINEEQLEKLLNTPTARLSPPIDLEDKEGIYKFSPATIKSFIELPKNYTLSERSESRSDGEHMCRNILEKRFSKKFLSVYPKFLLTPSKGKLELDCYYEGMCLALEFHGRQHYEFIPRFQNTIEDFHHQQWNDEFKVKQCRKNRIILIVVNGSKGPNKYDEIAKSVEKLLRGEIIEDEYVDVVANRGLFRQLIANL